MSNFKLFYPSIRFLPSGGVFSSAHKKYFTWFCAFWIFVAFLELGQDYISSVLQNNTFRIGDSLSYKLFWPLFIPFFIALDYGLAKADELLSGIWYVCALILQTVVVTFLHLFVFSLILYGVSVVIHDNPMTLIFLIYEKLSSRLYIALSIYSTLLVLSVFLKSRRSREAAQAKARPTTITVKNGRSAVVVEIADIKWIGSDGAYLDIHTGSQKHVILDSLKNIIQTLPDNFKRIHKSTIVNTNRIKKLESRGNGDYDVILDDGRELRLSRNYTKELRGSLL